jgi:hypothetical protein
MKPEKAGGYNNGYFKKHYLYEFRILEILFGAFCVVAIFAMLHHFLCILGM